MIKTIIIIVIGIVLGFLIGFPISKILIKKHRKKIAKESSDKILKQKESNFKTLQGKPVALNFRNDGKEVDLKKQIKDALIKTKIKEIKGYKDKIKEIKKVKKKVKKHGKTTRKNKN